MPAGKVRARDQAERAEAIKRLLFDMLRPGDTGAGGRPASQITLRDIADPIGKDIGPRLDRYPDAILRCRRGLATLYHEIDAQAQAWFDRQHRRNPAMLLKTKTTKSNPSSSLAARTPANRLVRGKGRSK